MLCCSMVALLVTLDTSEKTKEREGKTDRQPLPPYFMTARLIISGSHMLAILYSAAGSVRPLP